MIPMPTEKEQLREKLIDFQQCIASLKRDMDLQAQRFIDRETALLSGLFDVMDAFEALEANLESRKASLDKPARMLGKNIGSIHKKLTRTLKSNGIDKITFQNNTAVMTQCKILETKPDPDLADETLLEIVKNGYINTDDGSILRKAEVITVRNQSVNLSE
jgi:molecular chaperone GrpE (heat shock protein)